MTCPGTTSWLTSCWNSGKLNLQRGVDLVGSLVLRAAIRVARAAQIIHRAGEPRVLDGHEIDVGARHTGKFLRQHGQQVRRTQVVEVGDDGGTQRLDHCHRHDAVTTPGVHGVQQVAVRGGVPGTAQQLGNSLPLGFGLRRLRRLAGRSQHGAFVRNRLALAENFHRQFPHGEEAKPEPGAVLSAQSADLLRLAAHALHRGRQFHRAQIVLYRLAIDGLSANAAGFAHARRWAWCRPQAAAHPKTTSPR